MPSIKNSPLKSSLHPRNRHKQSYDLTALSATQPSLATFIIKNTYNNQLTIDFSDANAVIALNAALLKKYYQIEHWSIPKGFLCPPIPGRIDYIHYLADLLNESIKQKLITSPKTVKVLDIGTGASCIYPILGNKEYQWQFTASDIDKEAIKAAENTIKNNNGLAEKITCRLQSNADHIFNGIIKKNEFYHLTLCNPPFHHSLAEASKGSQRKWKNLNKSSKKQNLNFGGQKAELWCPGGEVAFIRKMIKESIDFKNQVLWFSCLVSKKDNLSAIKLSLKKARVSEIKTVKMAQGQKVSRFIAWRFANNK